MSQHLQSHNDAMTAARQTMGVWSRVIESRDHIPMVYQKYFDEQFHTAHPFPHVIWTPSLEKFPRKTTEKLICDTEDALHIFEKNGNQIDAKCYPYSDIHGSELGIVLLDSWLTIYGKTSRGETASSKIEVNTTSLRYFASIQNKLRPVRHIVGKAEFDAEKNKFNALSKINFKFMNYGRESLISGEIVLQILLQPEIRRPVWSFFGRTFYKTLTPAHLATITDQELILIQDVERVKESKIARYGGIWQYIPLHCIDSVTLSKNADTDLTLLIHNQSGKTIEKLFEFSNQSELETFCSQLQSLITNN